MEIKQFEKEGQIWFDVDGEEMPLYLENGELNQDLHDILNQEKENQGEIVVPTESNEELDEMREAEIEEANEVLIEKKNTNWFKKNWKRFVAVTLAVALSAGLITLLCKSCSKDNAKTQIQEVVEEKYSRELLVKRIKDFTAEANKKGINVTEKEVRDFAAMLNIDRIISEDPELAKELFDGKNAQELLSNYGHMIGIFLTNSHKSNYKNPINLSKLVVGSDYDKQILQQLEDYRDELTLMRGETPEIHRANFLTEEEDARFNEIITDVLNFYSMTSDGLETEFDNNSVIQKMGDGTRFATVLVMNEINIGNNNLLSKEQTKAFNELMSNEAVVANLHRMIEGCQTVEIEQPKVKTK